MTTHVTNRMTSRQQVRETKGARSFRASPDATAGVVVGPGRNSCCNNLSLIYRILRTYILHLYLTLSFILHLNIIPLVISYT